MGLDILNIGGRSGQGRPCLEGDSWARTQKKWGWRSWGCGRQDPNRKAGQWKDLGKALQEGWWDWSKGRAVEEVQNETGKQIMQSPVGNYNDSGFCSVWNGKPMQDSKQKDDSNLLKFWKDHSGCCVENRLQGGRNEAGGPIRKHCSNPGKWLRWWLEQEVIMEVVKSGQIMSVFWR